MLEQQKLPSDAAREAADRGRFRAWVRAGDRPEEGGKAAPVSECQSQAEELPYSLVELRRAHNGRDVNARAMAEASLFVWVENVRRATGRTDLWNWADRPREADEAVKIFTDVLGPEEVQKMMKESTAAEFLKPDRWAAK